MANTKDAMLPEHVKKAPKRKRKDNDRGEPSKELARVEPTISAEELQRRCDIQAHRRAMAAPVIASTGTWLTGEAAHLVELAAHQPWTVAAGTAASTACATCATRWWLGRKRVWRGKWFWRFWASGATAAGWTALASVAGPHWAPGWLLTGTLTTATVGLAGRWWREHRIQPATANEHDTDTVEDGTDTVAEPAKTSTQVTEPVMETVTEAGRIQQRWDDYLADQGKPFQNSWLVEPKELPVGWEFELILDPHKNEYNDLQPKRGKIAAVMGVDINDIQIESHPTRDQSRAVLKVLIANPLADGIDYYGPRYDNGYIAVGPWRDGTGWGSVRIADHKSSVMNGLVSGDPGAGKSVFLENLGMSALHSGRWLVFYCDGSPDNDSSPILSNYMTVSAAGIKGAWEQMEAVEEFMDGRGKENAALPPDIRGVDPSPERLGLLWIIDEFHALARADKRFASELESRVRVGRKRGAAVWTATQGLDLNLDFAGISTLRDILTSRNVVSFYSSSTYAHGLINGPVIAPHTLPSDGGYSYLRAAGSNRAAMLRTDYSDDMTPWARRLPPLSLEKDEIAELTVGDYIRRNQTTPEQSQANARRALEEYKKTRRLEITTGQPRQKSTPAPAQNEFSDLVGKMPAALTSADLRVVTGGAAKPSKKEAILTELRDRGEATTGDIAKATGFDLSLVSTTLARSAQKGDVRDAGHGKWAAVSSGEGVA